MKIAKGYKLERKRKREEDTERQWYRFKKIRKSLRKSKFMKQLVLPVGWVMNVVGPDAHGRFVNEWHNTAQNLR